MIFIDSNVLAYAFYDNKQTDRCQEIIKRGGLINTLNLVEAYNIIRFETSVENAVKSIRSLFKSNLKIVEVDMNVVFEALKRAEKYNKLKFIDLVHYVTCLLNNCESIASYDSDFDNLEIKRVT
ncbi:hypothetical protein COV18_07120 [Candidatus Woesearchaeota archaeon CG10_big_fil_rev_8_21_14_0_10_37_12]|nr:MAG: hypothetical protein COV18_07120 [Candidatus Woesearchaeota archaeon CG10_big_fil_rev_8_21_14_0_10_37_12]